MRSRRRIAIGAAAVVALLVVAGVVWAVTSDSGDSSSTSAPDTTQGVVTIRMVKVGDPGNKSVGVVSAFGAKGDFVNPPANGGIYATCADAPPGQTNCITVGGVDHAYEIGELEVTVDQYVTFLNTADPDGTNPHDVYLDSMSPTVWPKYGSIAYAQDADDGEHYSVAYPEWADKPFGFADFLRAARFVNSLVNGDILDRTESASDGFENVTYRVRLSPETESGMYDLSDPATKRTGSTGFVIPSNDEWVKAAYYDPKGGGTLSYWQYPTGPSDAPNASLLDPATGDVVNATDQPLSSYKPTSPNAPAGTYPTWCPPQVGAKACGTVNPLQLLPGIGTAYRSAYQANLSTVGQTRTRSPWGTLDQGGNVVEWQDTIVPPPAGYPSLRTWRRLHGGVTNAPSYQLLISAFGVVPEDDKLIGNVNPWAGFRVGVIGDLG
jgi:formylglycine-generating enzyme required for sulfatase activity